MAIQGQTTGLTGVFANGKLSPGPTGKQTDFNFDQTSKMYISTVADTEARTHILYVYTKHMAMIVKHINYVRIQ